MKASSTSSFIRSASSSSLSSLSFRLNQLSSRIASKLRWDCAREVARRSSSPPRHKLYLYDYEASPWCRLVREHITILNLNVHIRPCPRQTLFLEGSFSNTSRFRPEAMKILRLQKQRREEEKQVLDLQFPILVDVTNIDSDNNSKDVENKSRFCNDNVVVLTESYEILKYLWETYGKSVIPNDNNYDVEKNNRKWKLFRRRRPDQYINDTRIPFIIRFLSLAGPSYLRPFPTCGVLQTPSNNFYNDEEEEEGKDEDTMGSVLGRIAVKNKKHTIRFYQSGEGCHQARLVREVLCTLELPYDSCIISSSNNNEITSSSLKIDPNDDDNINIREESPNNPFLEILSYDKDDNEQTKIIITGTVDCVNYLWDHYWDSTKPLPSWTNPIPEPNLGRSGSFSVGAYTAFIRGSRAFVPSISME